LGGANQSVASLGGNFGINILTNGSLASLGIELGY